MDLTDRIEKLEQQQKDLTRTLVAVSNTLKVVDAAAFLALVNHSSVSLPENLPETYKTYSPYINEMIKKLSTTDTKEDNETQKPGTD